MSLAPSRLMNCSAARWIISPSWASRRRERSLRHREKRAGYRNPSFKESGTPCGFSFSRSCGRGEGGLRNPRALNLRHRGRRSSPALPADGCRLIFSAWFREVETGDPRNDLLSQSGHHGMCGQRPGGSQGSGCGYCRRPAPGVLFRKGRLVRKVRKRTWQGCDRRGEK